MQTSTDLSIVVIARNEAENIARAIESVLQAVDCCPHTEIVLVDSASTDETVEIARQYPIDIVRLKPSWVLSAAAGRYIGMHYTRGDLILYLDGDMELITDWLDQAIPFLLARPELAGVTGYRRDIYRRDGKTVGEQDERFGSEGYPVEVSSFGGGALYRRSALEQVCGFNPYIISEEEPELCMRLRHAGYKLVCLPHLMNRHYCIPPKSLAGHLRRTRLNMFLGFGQNLRYHWGTSLFWTYLLERGFPEVYQLAATALEACRVPVDVIVDDESAPYPFGHGFTVSELTTEGYSRLLRIERGRVRNREIFGPMRLQYGYFKLISHHSKYLVAREGGHIEDDRAHFTRTHPER